MNDSTLAIKMIAAPATRGYWADTSQVLTLSDYQFLALAGFKGCSRYVPRYNEHLPVITPSELQAALSVKCPDGTPFGIDFVQYARSDNVIAAYGTLDGQAAAEYVLKTLGVPNTVSVWQDLSSAAKADCIAYSNASYAAMLKYGLAASSPGCYCEPGYPLTADERYQLLNLHRYWATAANDPNRFVSHRGVQGIQAWQSNQGQYFPRPGLVIDGDLCQQDYFGDRPVMVCSA